MDIKYKYGCKRKLTVWIMASWEIDTNTYECSIEICKLNAKIDWIIINKRIQKKINIDKEIEKLLLDGAIKFANDNGYLDSIRKRMNELNIL